MAAFDYDAEAGLFPSRGMRGRPVGYRRFARAADAIRFAIEELPAQALAGAWLEVSEEGEARTDRTGVEYWSPPRYGRHKDRYGEQDSLRGRTAGALSMLKRWLPVIIALALAYSSASAQEARVDIGLLICGLGESADAESGSDAVTSETNKILCVFRPSNSGPEEVYAGAFQTIGRGQDLSQDRAMIWVVKASPATQRSTGLLQQLYSADRSAPPPYPPPLVGETNSEIVLQALDDPQALNSADKRSDAAVTIVLLALKLLSSPA